MFRIIGQEEPYYGYVISWELCYVSWDMRIGIKRVFIEKESKRKINNNSKDMNLTLKDKEESDWFPIF